MQRRIERLILAFLPTRFRARLQAAHAANKAVVRAGAWLIVFVVMAKAVAALKEVAVAYRYGTSPVLEGYLLAFNLATWPVSLAVSVLSAALVPALVRAQQGMPDGGAGWQRQITAWVWAVALAVGFGLFIGLPPLIRAGWLGLNQEGREAAITASPLMAVVSSLGIVASWYACQLMSRQRHANTLLEATPAVAILIAVLLVPTGSVGVLSWGTAVGFALQMGMLALLVAVAGMPVAPGRSTTKTFDGSLLGNFTVILIAQTILGLGGVIDQIVLAHLTSGNLAEYNYAFRIMSVFLALSAMVLGRALLPVLSGLPDARSSYEFARRWSGWIFWSGCFFMVILWLGSEYIVRGLFERGAFAANDAAAVANLLGAMSLWLPFYLLHIVLWQCHVSRTRAGVYLLAVVVLATLGKLCVVWSAIVIANLGAFSIVAGELMRLCIFCGLLLFCVKYVVRRSG